MKDRMKIVGERNDVRVMLDDHILFEKKGFGWWTYYHTENGQLTIESLKRFEDSHFYGVFLEDIIIQLENGTDRNDLKINIPKKIEYVKIGDRIVEI